MAETSPPTNPLEEEKQTKSQVLLIIRSVFLIMLVTVVMLALLRGGAAGSTTEQNQKQTDFFVTNWWIPLLIAIMLGAAAISLDALTPRKKLSGVSSIIFGLMAGLLATVAFSWIVDLLLEAHEVKQEAGSPDARIVLAIKAAFAITLCYLGVSVVYTTQDEFRLIIPYVEFSKQIRGTRPLILDTSAIIDGRFNDISTTGFITAPVVIPRFVIHELQALGDSRERLKRSRGRRGLDMIRKMQNNPHINLSITDEEVPGAGVDQKLLFLAQMHRAHLVTTDFNLNKVATIHEVRVLNVNDLANALKPTAIPGEELRVQIIKRGEGDTQGVGYLEDGTMVVIEHAVDHIGAYVTCTVTSSIQTSAGRMIFGDCQEGRTLPAAQEEREAGEGDQYEIGQEYDDDGHESSLIASTQDADTTANNDDDLTDHDCRSDATSTPSTSSSESQSVASSSSSASSSTQTKARPRSQRLRANQRNPRRSR